MDERESFSTVAEGLGLHNYASVEKICTIFEIIVPDLRAPYGPDCSVQSPTQPHG